MQFTLTDLQNEIKENSNKLLKENIDLLETLKVLANQNDLQLEALKKSNRILGEISNKQ